MVQEMALSELDFRLVDGFQRDLPLTTRPYAEIGERLGVAEWTVISRLARLSQAGFVSRVGAVFRPHSIGASILAAVAAEPNELERVAALVNAYPEVNHNYEREHRFNLWFVVTAADTAQVETVLDDIERRTPLQVLRLPLLQDYHIDLGFSLRGERKTSTSTTAGLTSPCPLGAEDRRLVRVLESGLPLTSRPYRELGLQLRRPEAEVIGALRNWLTMGVIRRLGVIVRHHELGYRANGMVVWDLPDGEVDGVGRRLAKFPCVTLCYQRPRRLPHWRYNLFTMIHGRDRDTVRGQVAAISHEAGLTEAPHEVLFSRRRFKQRGARYGLDVPVGGRRAAAEPNQARVGGLAHAVSY